MFAILPRWPGRRFTVQQTGTPPVASVALLGSSSPLRFTAGKDSVTIELPDLPEELFRMPAWVLRLSR